MQDFLCVAGAARSGHFPRLHYCKIRQASASRIGKTGSGAVPVGIVAFWRAGPDRIRIMTVPKRAFSCRGLLQATTGGALTGAMQHSAIATPLAYDLKAVQIADGTWMVKGLNDEFSRANGGGNCQLRHCRHAGRCCHHQYRAVPAVWPGANEQRPASPWIRKLANSSGASRLRRMTAGIMTASTNSCRLT